MAVTPSVSVLTQPDVARRFGTARFHTDGEVQALAFDPQGTLWSLENPGVLRSWDERGHSISRKVLIDIDTNWFFSPSAQLVAAACDELMIWETRTGRSVARIEMPSWLTTVAFHPNRQLVVTGDDEGMTRLWDPQREDPIAELTEHSLPVSALAFNGDGTLLASAGEDRQIKIWDLNNHKLVQTLIGHTDRIASLAWRSDSKILVSVGWDSTARVWELSTGEPRILLNTHDDQVLQAIFSGDGSLLATVDSASIVRVWGDVTSGQLLREIPGFADEIRAIAFRGDQAQLAIGGTDRIIRIYDPKSGQLLAGQNGSRRHFIAPWNVGVISTAGEQGLQAWSNDGTAQSSPLPPTEYLHITTSSNGRWMAGTMPNAKIQLWDNESKKLLPLDGPKSTIKYLAFSPDSRFLAGAVANEGTIWIWNLESLEPELLVIEATEGCSVETLAWHPDSTRIVCGGTDFLSTSGSSGAVCVWNAKERTRQLSIPLGASCVAFHPSGNSFVFATPEGWIGLHDTAHGEPILELEAADDQPIAALAFSPDGDWLLGCGADASLRVWDTATGEQVATRQFTSAGDDLFFRHDGVLFVAHENGTVSELFMRSLVEGL